MPSVLENLRTARQLFPKEGGVVYVDHTASKNGEKRVPAMDFFVEAGCPNAVIELMIETEDPDLKGNWKRFCNGIPEFYKTSPSALNRRLRKCLAPPYKASNLSLDHISDVGFNRHDYVHIQIDVDETVKILNLAGFGGNKKEAVDVRRRAVAAAHGHDLGNPFSRKIHSLISPLVFESLTSPASTEEVPSGVISDKKQWRIIRRAIQIHNEPVAHALLADIRRERYTEGEKKGQLTGRILEGEEFLAKVRERFGPEALALIIADKLDIGLHRVSLKPKDRDAVDRDQHLEVNLLGKSEGLSLSEDKKALSWKLQFTPGLPEKSEYKHFAKPRSAHDGNRAFVSRKTHERHQDPELPTPHFQTWQQLLWSLYIDRIHLTVQSAFALFPDAETFTISMVDDDGIPEEFRGQGLGQTVTEVFNRRTYEAQFKELTAKYVPEKNKEKPQTIGQSLADSLKHVVADNLDQTDREAGRQLLTLVDQKFPTETVLLSSASTSNLKSPSAVARAQQFEVNVPSKSDGLRLSEDGETMSWNVQFLPGPVVSQIMLERHLDPKLPMPYFHTWQQLLWRVYFEQIQLTVETAFATFPKLKRFEITMVDDNSIPVEYKGQGLGQTVKEVFARETFAAQFENLKIKYIPKDIRRKTITQPFQPVVVPEVA